MPIAKKTTSEKCKLILTKNQAKNEPWMKKIGPKKLKKTVKIKVKLPHVIKKTTSEKANFSSSNVFSLYSKISAKIIHAAKPLAFSLHLLFRRDQNHYSNLTSKIMKMCEQILKKHSRKNSGNDSKEKIAHTYD